MATADTGTPASLLGTGNALFSVQPKGSYSAKRMSSVKDTSEPDLTTYPKIRDRVDSRGVPPVQAFDPEWDEEQTSYYSPLPPPAARVTQPPAAPAKASSVELRSPVAS